MKARTIVPMLVTGILTTVLGLGAAGSAQASEACAGTAHRSAPVDQRELADAVGAAVRKREITRAQAAEAMCEPSKFVDVASESVAVVESGPTPAQAADILQATTARSGRSVNTTALGSTVACKDKAKRITSKNIFGMTLIWHETRVHWCWDRNLTITSASSGAAQDSPGLCWGYQGAAPAYRSGGRGWHSYDVSLGSNFSCVSKVGLSRVLRADLYVTGGGGAS